MKRVLIIMTLAILLVLPASLGGARAAFSQDPREPADVNALSGQIDIMRLVLSRGVNTRFNTMTHKLFNQKEGAGEGTEPEGEGAGGAPAGAFGGGLVEPSDETDAAMQAYTEALMAGGQPAPNLFSSYQGGVQWTSGRGVYGMQHTSHTRGFYAPGFGVFFTTEISTPTHLVVDEPDETEPVDLDAWDRAEREVQGDWSLEEALLAAAGERKTPGRWVISETFVDAAVDEVIGAIAKYGLRLDELPEHESISVGLRFEPGMNLSSMMTDEGESVSLPGMTSSSGLQSYVVTSLGSIKQASVKHVVIQIAKSDVRRLQEGGLDEQSFRDRVSITSY